MTDTSKTRMKVGVTVFAAILILLFGVSFLKDLKLGLETNELTTYFKDVNGLKEGDQVGVNGVKKGKVRKIELSGDSVRVDFYLEKDVILKKDYTINVAMIELMSGKQISISPGTSKELADITKPLVGSKSQDVVSLIQTMNNVGDDVKEITVKLSSTTDNLNKTILSVNDLVSDEGLKSNIRGTASNFNVASKELNMLISENRINLNQLTSKLNSVANSVDNTFTETGPDVRKSIENVKVLTSRIDTLTMNLNQLVANANDTNSTVGKLMTQDEMYNSLSKTLSNINNLLKDMNKMIRKDGIKISIF